MTITTERIILIAAIFITGCVWGWMVQAVVQQRFAGINADLRHLAGIVAGLALMYLLWRAFERVAP